MIYVGKRSYAVYLVNLICLAVCVEIVKHVKPSIAFIVGLALVPFGYETRGKALPA